MAGENGHVERPASPKELEESLARIYTGKANVAIQAQELNMPLEHLKQLFRKYVSARPGTIHFPAARSASSQETEENFYLE